MPLMDCDVKSVDTYGWESIQRGSALFLALRICLGLLRSRACL